MAGLNIFRNNNSYDLDYGVTQELWIIRYKNGLFYLNEQSDNINMYSYKKIAEFHDYEQAYNLCLLLNLSRSVTSDDAFDLFMNSFGLYI